MSKETTFFEIISKYVETAPSEELMRIKELVDTCLGDTTTFKGRVKVIKITQGKIPAIKFVKDEMNWGLVQAKEFVDAL